VSDVRRLNDAGPSLFKTTSRSCESRSPGAKSGALRNSGSLLSQGYGKWVLAVLAIIALFTVVAPAFAQAAPAVPSVAAPAAPTTPGVGDAVDRALGQLGGPGAAAATNGAGKAPLSLSLQVLIIMGLLTILPGLLLMMTSFTRIIIVLSLLRQALGLQQTPPNQVLIGLSLMLSLFVMAPTINQINTQAIQPYAAGQIQGTELISRAGAPLHAFMVKQTRVKDLTMFAQMAKSGPYKNSVDVPFSVLLPAFITSELKTAFQIGFLIFLPFIVIDLVVATVLMSLGMMMMSPTIISMPFKLLLFVLVDGWAMMMGSLAGSFAT
jgi:flagellar biosynthetic protein FliP